MRLPGTVAIGAPGRSGQVGEIGLSSLHRAVIINAGSLLGPLPSVVKGTGCLLVRGRLST